MIVKDFNQMSIEELQIIAQHIGVDFQINDGKIVGAVGNDVE